MRAKAHVWTRCHDPCGFEHKLCPCGELHTHFMRRPGCIQDIWPVACDVCAGDVANAARSSATL